MSKLNPDDEETVRRFASWKHRRQQPATADADAPDPQQTYAELMKTAFAPALRDAGLRGSAGRFEFPSETHWVQLGFQKSAHSDRHELRFTVNLSVIRRNEWDEQLAAKPYLGTRPTPNKRYGSWADQTRIGTLTPEGQDKWWRIIYGADTTPVRDDVLSDLINYGVPWLREHATN